MNDESLVNEIKSFLDEHIDSRLEYLQTLDNRTANYTDRTAELEVKIKELEIEFNDLYPRWSDHNDRLESIESYDLADHEARLDSIEEKVDSVSKSEISKDLSAIIERTVHELAVRGQLRIYVADTPKE